MRDKHLVEVREKEITVNTSVTPSGSPRSARLRRADAGRNERRPGKAGPPRPGRRPGSATCRAECAAPCHYVPCGGSEPWTPAYKKASRGRHAAAEAARQQYCVNDARKICVSKHLASSRALTSMEAWMHWASPMKSCTSTRAATMGWNRQP